MFNRKKKQPVAEPDNAAGNNDSRALESEGFIVHNMPRPQQAASIVNGKSVSVSLKSFPTAGQPRSNFKMVGLLILAGGILLIGGLIYLSYSFIIKPTATPETNIPASNAPTSGEKTVASSTDNISPASTPITPAVSVIATATELSTTTPAVLDLGSATSSASIDQTLINGTPSAPILDSDSDGLTDEEEAVFGTSATAVDSNNNSYPDLTEINNNYNPAAAGRLETNANLVLYSNTTFGYKLLYPKSWPSKVIAAEATVVFTAPDESLIQISVQENPDQTGILGWYNSAFPGTTVTYDKMRSTGYWDGVMSDDGFNFYLTGKDHKNIFVISYIPSADGRVAYPNIFQMMINTLVIKP